MSGGDSYEHFLVVRFLSDEPDNLEVKRMAGECPVYLYTPENLISVMLGFFSIVAFMKGNTFVRIPPSLDIQKTFTGAMVYKLLARFSVLKEEVING